MDAAHDTFYYFATHITSMNLSYVRHILHTMKTFQACNQLCCTIKQKQNKPTRIRMIVKTVTNKGSQSLNCYIGICTLQLSSPQLHPTLFLPDCAAPSAPSSLMTVVRIKRTIKELKMKLNVPVYNLTKDVFETFYQFMQFLATLCRLPVHLSD